MAAFLKVVLAGCLLCLCSSLGDASLARVTSLTGAVVEQSVAHAQRNVFGHGKQASRFKREVLTKKLEDPNGCIKKCRDDEVTQMTASMMKNMARLVSLALEDIKGDEVSTPEKEEAFKSQVEEKTIANMGPLFEDLCKVEKSASVCLSKCPESEGRTILTIDNEGTQAAFCEPGKNWNNFTEYWTALNCTNSTELDKPCENKCGPEQHTRNATKLEISETDVEIGDDDDDDSVSSGDITLSYETDAKKNTEASGPVCKAITCQIDCYKPIMSEKCGAKAYDMYSRMTKLEPNSSLRMLKALKAIESNSDCKDFE